uniref:Secreted protein n=1 Tax=Ascaris lumbricoides TaxID=6252 RepID=A0A0M3I222_ASCLU
MIVKCLCLVSLMTWSDMWRILLLVCISAYSFVSTTDAAFQLHYDDDRLIGISYF